MRGLCAKILALLLVVWYSMSIIGFGVHTCSGSGESFVVTFVEGFDCEDIHPEHHCTKGLCCSHHHSRCDSEDYARVRSESCCTSDYQVLALTGAVSDEKNGLDHTGAFIYCNCISSKIFGYDAELQHAQLIFERLASASFLGRMPDMQSLFGVWRI